MNGGVAADESIGVVRRFFARPQKKAKNRLSVCNQSLYVPFTKRPKTDSARTQLLNEIGVGGRPSREERCFVFVVARRNRG